MPCPIISFDGRGPDSIAGVCETFAYKLILVNIKGKDIRVLGKQKLFFSTFVLRALASPGPLLPLGNPMCNVMGTLVGNPLSFKSKVNPERYWPSSNSF